jgi:hypothetical protein
MSALDGELFISTPRPAHPQDTNPCTQWVGLRKTHGRSGHCDEKKNSILPKQNPRHPVPTHLFRLVMKQQSIMNIVTISLHIHTTSKMFQYYTSSNLIMAIHVQYELRNTLVHTGTSEVIFAFKANVTCTINRQGLKQKNAYVLVALMDSKL